MGCRGWFVWIGVSHAFCGGLWLCWCLLLGCCWCRCSALRLRRAASSGLVAAYSFDEGSGTAVGDASGTGNDGTVSNATWSVSGKYGGALSFNGTSARVNVPSSASLQLTGAMTLEAWVNPTSTTSRWRDVIYKGNDNYYLEGTSTNGSKPDAGVIAGGSYGDAYGTAALPANAWSFLVETYDGATLRLYVNGAQVAATAHTGAISTSTSQLQIGGDSIYGQYFGGLIDEVRVYNVALSAAAIQTDMNTPIAAGGDTTPPSAPGTLNASAVERGRDRSFVGCGVRRRCCDRLPGVSVSGLSAARVTRCWRPRRGPRRRIRM